MSIKRIAVTTGGGDAPGLNAVIRAVTLASLKRGWNVLGIMDGYNGLLNPELFTVDGGVMPLDRAAVRGISHLGGTILGSTNRGNPFQYEIVDDEGNHTYQDISQRLFAAIKKYEIDAIISIGGDGSMGIAHRVAQMGINIVGVPKTIDNDLVGTIATFGFDTAVGYATDAIGRLHSTAASHDRVMVVEVMGRHTGWIALHSGVAASADVILIPEIPYDINEVARKINERNSDGHSFAIVVVAEGALPMGGEISYLAKGDVKRLGGVGNIVADQLRHLVPNEIRTVVLGHLLRGGSPSARDRLLALRFGAAAVRAVAEDRFGVMVALNPPEVNYVPLEVCATAIKTVPIGGDTIATARDLGIEFGDTVPRFS